MLHSTAVVEKRFCRCSKMALNCKLIMLIGSFGLINSENHRQHSLKTNSDFEKLIHGVGNRTQQDNSNISLADYDGHDASKVPHCKLDLVTYEELHNLLQEMVQNLKRGKFQEFANHIKPPLPFHGCANDSHPRPESRIPTFQINLDSKPEERWTEVVKQKKNELKELSNLFQKSFGETCEAVLDKIMSLLHRTLPQEYLLEVSGISREADISVGRVTLFNIFYEFSAICTSIVVEGEDGRMYHGRNLDFGQIMGWDAKHHTWFLTEILGKLIVKVEFMKGGKQLYSAVTYAGYTGILTGLKKNRFSLSIDQRFNLNGGYVGLVEWILGQRDLSWVGLLTRRVMQSAATYQQAQQMLASPKLLAPVYFILAGNSSGEGCVITRGREYADIWKLGGRHKDQNGTWYLVQTNYDHWFEGPWYDQRRHFAVLCMDQLGRHRPLDTLYRVLSTAPVLNEQTTLTALMDVSAGHLQVWQRV